ALAQGLIEAQSAPLAGDAPRLVAWNWLGWTRSEVAEAEVELPEGYEWATLHNGQGEEVPLQITPLSRHADGRPARVRLAWTAEALPAWGYETYTLQPAAPPPPAPTPAPLVLENAQVRVQFRPNGE